MTWHAFNWNGEHKTAPTKRELIDSLGFILPRVRRYSAGNYEVTGRTNGRMWWVYSSLEQARANGFEEKQSTH